MTLEELTAENAELKKQLATAAASIAAMQAKTQELLDETKKAKAEKRAAEEAASSDAKKKAEAEGDYKQLLESSEAARKKLADELQKRIDSEKKTALNSEAMRIATGLTRDAKRAELLADRIKSRLSVTENGIKVLDADGNLTVSPIEDLVNQIKNDFPFLVDGSNASGGGATGANGGAVSKKFDEMNGAELAKLRKEKPEEYARLRDEYKSR